MELFSSVLDNANYNPNEAIPRAAQEWNNLADEEKEEYRMRAQNVVPPIFEELPEAAQKAKIKMTRKKIIALVCN